MELFISPVRGVKPLKDVLEAITTIMNSGTVSKCVIDPTGIGGPIADKLMDDGFRVTLARPSSWKELAK